MKKFFLPKLRFASKVDGLTKLCLLGTLIVLGITFVLAVVVAPNDIDAMKYHLGRIPHWVQNQNISYYPTHITWQLYVAPWASYPQLHFYLLSGGDYFANLVQWIFTLGSLIGVSLIAKYFSARGGSRSAGKVEILSVFIAATIPMGILQASATQTDYIFTFFFVCFIYFSLRTIGERNYFFIFIASSSLGLACLTKTIAYIYAFPFLVLFFWLWLKQHRVKTAFAYLIILVITTLTINLGFFARNYAFAGSPLFSFKDYFNRPIGIESLASGTIKNASIHLSTPIPGLNSMVYDSILSVHKLVGIPVDKIGFNWQDRPFEIPRFAASEYTTGNTLHLVLIIITTVALFIYKYKNISKYYLLSLTIGFLAFSGVMRWQIGDSRWHLPLFVAWSPLIALMLVKWGRAATYFVVASLLISSLFFLLFNRNKPLILQPNIFAQSRDEQYFTTQKQLYQPYNQMVEFVHKGEYKSAGLILEEATADYEYPIWLFLKRNNPKIIIKHVSVENLSKSLAPEFKPDVVLFIGGNRELVKKYIDADIPIIGVKK